MKKFILLIFTVLMMVGCSRTVKSDTKLCEKHYHTIILDSCEYMSNDKRWDMTHKGNCRFCKERRQKELEELAIKLKEK